MMIRFPMIFPREIFLSGSARKTAGQKHRRQYRSPARISYPLWCSTRYSGAALRKRYHRPGSPASSDIPAGFCIPYWHSASEVPGKLPKKVPASMISINVLFISLHHPDSDQNDQDADDVLKRKIFVKNDHSPYLGPQKIDAFVGVGRGKRKFLITCCHAMA